MGLLSFLPIHVFLACSSSQLRGEQLKNFRHPGGHMWHDKNYSRWTVQKGQSFLAPRARLFGPWSVKVAWTMVAFSPSPSPFSYWMLASLLSFPPFWSAFFQWAGREEGHTSSMQLYQVGWSNWNFWYAVPQDKTFTTTQYIQSNPIKWKHLGGASRKTISNYFAEIFPVNMEEEIQPFPSFQHFSSLKFKSHFHRQNFFLSWHVHTSPDFPASRSLISSTPSAAAQEEWKKGFHPAPHQKRESDKNMKCLLTCDKWTGKKGTASHFPKVGDPFLLAIMWFGNFFLHLVTPGHGWSRQAIAGHPW